MKKYIFVFLSMMFLAGTIFSNRIHATIHQVQVGNYSFNPSSMNVIIGDTVKWIWVSGTHTTTSTTIPPGATSWDSPITSSNPSYEYVVTVEGTYNYKCSIHASMGMVGSFVASSHPLTVDNHDVVVFRIFPDPVTSKLTISFEAIPTPGSEISVFDLNSTIVLGPVGISDKIIDLDLSNLSEGIYFVCVSTVNGNTIKRVIKQK